MHVLGKQNWWSLSISSNLKAYIGHEHVAIDSVREVHHHTMVAEFSLGNPQPSGAVAPAALADIHNYGAQPTYLCYMIVDSTKVFIHPFDKYCF